MPAPSKASILQCLPAARLRELADACGVDSPRRSKTDLLNGFARYRRLAASSVQLINAGEWYRKLRKNLGQKNCEFADKHIQQIIDTYTQQPESKTSTPLRSLDEVTQEILALEAETEGMLKQLVSLGKSGA